MGKRRVFAMATPSQGVVSFPWMLGVQGLMWPMNCTKTIIPFYDRVGGQIAEGRNAIVAMARQLNTPHQEVTHIFWLDDDVVPMPSVLLRLLSHQADVAAGVYFSKTDVGEPLIFPGRGEGTMAWKAAGDTDPPIPTYGFPLGLSVMKFDVFDRIDAAFPDLPKDRYGNPEYFRTPTEADATFEDGILSYGGTEDFILFDRLQAIGARVLVDCSKWAFGWHMDKATLEAFPTNQWGQYKTGQNVTWPDGTVWTQGPQKQEQREPAACAGHGAISPGSAA